MDSIVLKAHAKVNIGLQVNLQRKDGYHNIQTVFQEIKLYDTLSLIAIQRDCKIEIDDDNIPNDYRNICAQAYLVLKEEFPQIGGILINITKQIPTGAGLGGGSSDAAATLKGLNQIYNLSLSATELCDIAVKIGADVPFFITGGTQLGEGIGEQLTFFPKPVVGHYLLIVPDIFISTTWAYKALKKHLDETTRSPNFADFFERKTLTKAIFDNDFERIVVPTYPKIGIIMEGLTKAGAFYASLSGSGSTVFGIFDEEAKAIRAESYFKLHYRTFLTEPTNN